MILWFVLRFGSCCFLRAGNVSDGQMMNRQLEAMTDRFALFQIRPKPTKIKASVERKLHDSMVPFTTQIRPKPTKIEASVERKLHDSLARNAGEAKGPVS